MRGIVASAVTFATGPKSSIAVATAYGPEVHQRAGELGVQERGGGMPLLRRAGQQADLGDGGGADHAVVDRLLDRLDPGAEERVRRRADQHAGARPG